MGNSAGKDGLPINPFLKTLETVLNSGTRELTPRDLGKISTSVAGAIARHDLDVLGYVVRTTSGLSSGIPERLGGIVDVAKAALAEDEAIRGMAFGEEVEPGADPEENRGEFWALE